MTKPTLAFFDSNTEHMEKLYRYLSEDKNLKLSLSAFTSEEKLNEYLNKESIDYLLVSDDKAEMYKGVSRVIRIYDDSQKDGIYRYSPADKVVKRLTELLDLDSVSDHNDMNPGCKFIGVYSPVGRSMKTSFSVVLGQMLSKKNRVLYLNFESFSGMDFYDSMSRNSNLSDVLYYFNNIRNEFTAMFKNSLVSYNGLDMIRPAYYYLDLSYITAETWNKFLHELEEMGEYDYIILDLSDYLQGIFDVFLTRCSVVYTLSANDPRAQSKIFQYEQILNEYNHEDILQKTKKFVIPTIRNLPKDLDRLLYTELADYVRKETMADFHW